MNNTRLQIQNIIEKEIAPAIRSHNGDIELVDYSNETATIALKGACAGCPAADLSTKAFIEEVLIQSVPEIKRVEISNTLPDDMLDFARQILSGKIK